MQKRKRQLEKEKVMHFQDLCAEVKKDPAFRGREQLLKSVQIPVLYERCKSQKILKEQFRDFIMAEFTKQVRGRSRSTTPEKRDMAAPVTVEHREKNIFSSKKPRGNSKTSSTSSQGKSNSGAVDRAKNFQAIREYEDEEDSMVQLRDKEDLFDKVIVLKASPRKATDETPDFKHLSLRKVSNL